MPFWQSAAWTLANVQLRDDLHDIASQPAARIGWVDFKIGNDFRYAVNNMIFTSSLKQITVRRSRTLKEPIIYLATEYNTRVDYLDSRSLYTSFRRVRSDLEHLTLE